MASGKLSRLSNKMKRYQKNLLICFFSLGMLLVNVKSVEASIAFRAVSAKAAGTTGATTVALPTGVAANDIVILVATTIAGGTVTISSNGSITSWTEITSSGLNVASGEKLYVWWGRYSSGSTGPSVTPGSDHVVAATLAYSGVITSGSPINVSATGTETTSDTSFSFATGLITTTDGTMNLVAVTSGLDSNTAQFTNAFSNTSLSAIATRANYETSNGGGGGFGVAQGLKATAGTAGTWTQTLTTASPKAYLAFALIPQNTTTLANGTNPGNATIAPGASATDLDTFTFTTDNSTDTINSLTATLSPSGAYNNISQVDLTDNSNNIKCSVSLPSSNTLSFTSCALAITTSTGTYKLRVTPKSHTNMDSPATGTSYATTGTISSWTSGNSNTQAGSDSGSATITIDNLSPGNVTSATATAGDQHVDLSWTNPNDSDFTTNGDTIVLRRASSNISDTPTEGVAYSAGNTIGNSTVVCVNSGSPPSASCTDSGLTNGTSYYYKIFTQDSNGNNSSNGVSPSGSPAAPVATTTLSTSTDPVTATVAPGSGIRSTGQFTYTTSSGSDTITSLTLTLGSSPTGSYNALNDISIRSGSCTGTLYFSAVTPSSNSVSFSGGTALPVSAGGNTYVICVTPKDQTLATGTYSISPYVSSTWTSGNGNTKTGTDTNANTLTIDNTPPNSATSVSGVAGNTKITMNWTTSNSSDFNTTAGSVVYRWTGNSAGSEVPTEGSSPVKGSTNSTATVACVTSSNSSTSQSKTDGSSGSSECTTTALTNGQAYTYKVFQKDSYGNYDSGTTMGTFSPTDICSSITTGNWSSGSSWTGACSGGSGQPIAGDNVQVTAGTSITVDGAQAASRLNVSNTGTLTFGNVSSLTLNGNSGTLLTNNGSLITVANSSVIIKSQTAPTAILSGSFTGSNAFYDLTLSPTISGAVGYSLGAAFTTNHNFTIDPTSSGLNTLTTTLGGTTTVVGTTLIEGETSALSNLDTGTNYSLISGTINITAAGTLTANNSTITLNGTTGPLFTRTGTFTADTSTVIFSESTSDLVLTSGTVNFNNFQIDMSGKTGTLGNTITTGGNLILTNGTLADGGYQIIGNNSGTLSITSSSKLTLGSSTSTTFPTLFSNFSLAAGNVIEYASSQSQNILNSPPYSNLTISGASVKSLQGTTTINGNLTINNTATLSTSPSNYNINLKGNWINQGTFSPGTGTVTFTGIDNGTQSISGNNTFYNLAISTASNAAGKTLQFAGSSTTTVQGTWTVSGASGKLISLNSTDSNPWTISPTLSSINYAQITLSTNTVNSICATASIDGGSNTGYTITSESACTVAPTVPAGTPVVYYKFDEGYGSISNNSSSSQLSLPANTSNVSWSNEGKIGNCLSFDGDVNSVSATNNNILNITEDLSISAWIKPTSFGENNLGRIFEHISGQNGYSFMLNGSNNRLRFSAGSTNIDSSANVISLNTWQHVMVVRNGTTITFYVNGKPSGTGTLTTISSAAGTTSYIGNNAAGAVGFAGLIDELKVFSSSLDESQVKLENNNGSFVSVGQSSASNSFCVVGDSSPCAAPVVELKFEEGKGSVVNDTSSRNNHGNFPSGSDTPIWTSGKIGKAVKFIATNHSHFTIGDSQTNRVSSTGTISVWINPTAYPSDKAVIVNKGNFSSNINNYSLYYEHSTSSLVLSVNGTITGSSVKIPQTSTPLDTWSYVSASWDGSFLYLYVNGQYKNKAAMNGFPNTNSLDISIGGDITNNNFSGKLDNLVIFNYARTPAQIAFDYNKGEPIAWWKMDECSGNTTNDSSGNSLKGTITIGNTGTQTTVGTCSTSSTAWGNGSTGKINRSVNFDGSDDQITASDATLPSSNISRTVSLWVKPNGTQNKTLFGYGTASTNLKQFDIVLQSGIVGVWWNNNNPVTNFSHSTYVANQWNHIVMTYDGTNIRSYINGSLKDTVPVALDTLSTGTFYLGRGMNSTYTYFSGQIDDLRIYNYPLSADQVKLVFNNGAMSFGSPTGTP